MLRPIIRFCLRERFIPLLAGAVIVAVGWYSYRNVPVDAIPDVGEKQVIVLTSWPGRSPRDVEDQITYPLSVGLRGVPGALSVRGKSMFGDSFVQVTFADNVDFYWARARVVEQLITLTPTLPEGVRPTVGPDATALGQIFLYVLDPPSGMDLAELRSFQDYVVKYALQSVEGVAEVASIGGHVRQYQVEIDPDRLRFYGIPLDQVVRAVKESNQDVGAETIEQSGMEFLVRGRGLIGGAGGPGQAVADLERSVVVSRDGVPICLKDLGRVQLGPEPRRGFLDLDGSEAVGGVVAMRLGENPRRVIERVKARIAQLEPSLDGVTIRPIYDRTMLIDETTATLTEALGQEILITIAVILLFLLHIRSSIVVAATLPIAVLMAFIAMRIFSVDANIMSLGRDRHRHRHDGGHGDHRLGEHLSAPGRVGARGCRARRGPAPGHRAGGR